MLVLTASLYYLKNTYVNILSLIIVLVYVFITNKDLIQDIKKMIFKKRKKAE